MRVFALVSCIAFFVSFCMRCVFFYGYTGSRGATHQERPQLAIRGSGGAVRVFAEGVGVFSCVFLCCVRCLF